MGTLDTLFSPKSVAIVGVSSDTKKIGTVIFNNLKNIGFEGIIYVVNPKYQELFGHKCYPSLKEIENDIDLVCISIPKEFVYETVKDCVNKNVKNIVIITAGYSEIGKAGQDLETGLLDVIKGSNTRILGPNCLGLISSINKINVSFAATSPNIGNIAFLSQSGAVCTAILDMAHTQKLGFSSFVSIGNKIDITESELLSYFLKDNNTKVISAYLEEVNNNEIFSTYSQSVIKKPLIILKPGKTKEAKTAMLSHTGSIATDEVVFDAMCNKHFILNVNSVELLYNLTRGFSWGKEIKGLKSVIITNAGGPGIITTDSIIQQGLELSEISSIEQELGSILPSASSTHNPIDLLGDADSKRYKDVLELVVKQSNVDIVFILLTPQFVTEIDLTTQYIIDINKSTDKTIVPIYLGDASMQKCKEMFDRANIPMYYEIDEAVDVIKNMYKYYSKKAIKIENKIENIQPGKYFVQVQKSITNTTLALDDQLIENISNEIELPLPTQRYCKTLEEALDFAKKIYPVVIKAPNSVIAHKSLDITAMYTNVQNEEELSKRYKELVLTIHKIQNSYPPYLLIQKQVSFEQEIIIGIKRIGEYKSTSLYSSNEYLLMIGKGGIYSEIYNDFSFSILPINDDEIQDMLSNTVIGKILLRGKSERKFSIGKIVDVILRLQRLVKAYPQIDSLDINPLFIDYDSVCAVDIKITVSK